MKKANCNGSQIAGDLLAKILEELRSGFSRLDGRLDSVNARLDKVIENTGSHWRTHEDAIRALGEKLRQLEGEIRELRVKR